MLSFMLVFSLFSKIMIQMNFFYKTEIDIKNKFMVTKGERVRGLNLDLGLTFHTTIYKI